VAQAAQIRSAGKLILLCIGIVLIGALALLQATPAANNQIRAAAIAMDKAPEPAAFGLIGGALCLLSLRLRRRTK
jgi:hypothetical protein